MPAVRWQKGGAERQRWERPESSQTADVVNDVRGNVRMAVVCSSELFASRDIGTIVAYAMHCHCSKELNCKYEREKVDGGAEHESVLKVSGDDLCSRGTPNGSHAAS